MKILSWFFRPYLLRSLVRQILHLRPDLTELAPGQIMTAYLEDESDQLRLQRQQYYQHYRRVVLGEKVGPHPVFPVATGLYYRVACFACDYRLNRFDAEEWQLTQSERRQQKQTIDAMTEQLGSQKEQIRLAEQQAQRVVQWFERTTLEYRKN